MTRLLLAVCALCATTFSALSASPEDVQKIVKLISERTSPEKVLDYPIVSTGVVGGVEMLYEGRKFIVLLDFYRVSGVELPEDLRQLVIVVLPRSKGWNNAVMFTDRGLTGTLSAYLAFVQNQTGLIRTAPTTLTSLEQQRVYDKVIDDLLVFYGEK